MKTGKTHASAGPRTTRQGPPDAALVANLWLCLRYRLTRDQFVRWQRVVSVALEHLHRTRCTDLDESFWSALRDALVVAGATEREIDLVAAAAVRIVVREIAAQALAEAAADPELTELPRDELIALIDEELIESESINDTLLEPIAQYLARTDMTVRFGPGGCVRSVEFPDRPGLH